jgi:hypothetical protein
MFKKTTITMTLATIATVAVNMQAPVFAAEPSTDLAITETVGMPGLDSFTMTAPTLEDALEDYLAGLGPEEGDFGGSAEVAELPEGVIEAIGESIVELPGLGGLPPLTGDDTASGATEDPDEGAELPLDPDDVCGDEGVACEFATPDDGSGGSPWDVPLGDDEEAPFDDHGWVEPDHDEASDGTSTGTDSGVDTPETTTEPAATATDSVVPTTAVSTDDESTPIGDSVDDDVAEVTSILAATADEGPNDGFGPAEAAMAGIIAMILIAGLGFGALKMGRKGA